MLNIHGFFYFFDRKTASFNSRHTFFIHFIGIATSKKYKTIHFCLSKLSWIKFVWASVKINKKWQTTRGTYYPRGGFSCKEYQHWKHWCVIELAVL